MACWELHPTEVGASICVWHKLHNTFFPHMPLGNFSNLKNMFLIWHVLPPFRYVNLIHLFYASRFFHMQTKIQHKLI